MKKNSLNKTYWEERYLSKQTGWDIGYPSTPLREFIDGIANKSTKILVPGSGNSYEIEYLWNQGFKNVYAMDIAKQPLNRLKNRMTNFPEHQLLNIDFFEAQGTYDFILEQTFFCALHPWQRQDYVKKMFDLLSPEGKIAGLLFNFPLTTSGPPFGGSKDEYKKLFSPYFNIKVLEPAINSIKERKGKELFFIFEKKR